MMKKTPLILIFILTLGACESSQTSTQLNPDEVIISYQAKVDDAGSCQPTYTATTQNDADGLPANKLYMINGETNYYNQDGVKINNIPLQIKMGKENISVMNDVIACDQLVLKLTIEQCKYEWGTDRTDCPKIIIKGQKAFGGISIEAE